MRALKLSFFSYISLLICNFSYAADYGNPVENSSMALFLTFEDKSHSIEVDNELRKLLPDKERPNLESIGCVKPEQNNNALWVGPALIPVITAIGGRLFDKYQDAKLDRLKKLKKDSTNEYSKTIYLNSTQLKTVKCALLFRYTLDDKKNPQNGFVAYLKFDHKKNYNNISKGFTFTPVHLAATNTTVKTITNKKQPLKSTITTAIAVSVKAVTEDKHKLATISSLGAASVGISNVVLDGKEKCVEKSDCEESDLIPHIDNDTVVALSVSVSEMGHVGIDFDKEEAEINAIKAAYGPALKESLSALLTKE